MIARRVVVAGQFISLAMLIIGMVSGTLIGGFNGGHLLAILGLVAFAYFVDAGEQE